MKKKILSLFLALTLCLSLLPTAALATENTTEPSTQLTEPTPVPEEPEEPETPDQPEDTKTPDQGEETKTPDQGEDDVKDEAPVSEEQEAPAVKAVPLAANSEFTVRSILGDHPNTKSHCICNTYQCSKHPLISTWLSITSEDDLKNVESGKAYSLANDIELTETWKPQGTIYLCMNGHSITMSSTSTTLSLIEVGGGDSACYLSITNCLATVGGGRIRHSEGAVDGPGITVSNGGTVELFGGKITQNSDGVVVQDGGTLNMPSNSEVSGNTGAGVRLEEGGTLNMSGGNIESNKGCGVDVAQGSTFNISGGTKILSNTKKGETCNVYLHNGATMKVSELSTARIGVTVETLPTDGNFVPVTSDGKASRSDQNCITSDNANCRVFYSTSKSAGNLVLDARPTPLHADHDSKTFINSLSSSDSKLLINGEEAGTYSYNGTTYYDLPDGNYYLEGDLTLSCGLLAYSTNVVLCLNGHNITVTGNRPVVCVGKKTAGSSSSNGEVTLTDCGTDGTLTHSDGLGGGVYVHSGTFIMRGGKISGNSYGVDVYQGNEFEIYGGEISGNKGYGVSLTPDSKSYIYMTVGGTAKITGNWANGTYNAENHLYEQGTTGTAKNVWFTEKPYKYITVHSSLAEGAEIGVTIWKTLTAERDCVAVATCGTSSSADVTPYVGYFKSDSDAYKVWSSNNNVVIGVWNLEDQIHPICGAVCNHKDANGDPIHEDIVWTPVSSASQIYSSDNIYLTDDITLTRTWEISGDTGTTQNLCLNGHTITAAGDFDAITIKNNNYTLNICDCKGGGKITHGTKDDSTKYSGSGVYLSAYSGRNVTVNMYGGTITGNTGHSVTVKGTDLTRGGGVYVDDYGTLNMCGGSITGNTAAQGGGVYYSEAGLTVSGNAKITGNTGTDGKANNVWVPYSNNTDGCRPFKIGEGRLQKDAEIGITYDRTIETGKYITFALHAEKGCSESNFTSDKEGDYGFKKEADHDNDPTLRGTEVVNLYNGLPHEHPICGKTCTDGAHTGEDDILTWIGVSSLSDIIGAGNYYLTQDVTTYGWTVPTVAEGVNLCLNGHSITRKYDDTWQGAVIAVTYKSQGNLHGKIAVCDCNGSGKGNGQITHEENAGGVGVQLEYASTFDMYGGRITGNNGYGVNVGGSAAFHMYGGSITGNSYGVDVDGTMTVSGDVKITDNTNGNADLSSGRTITVSGALGESAKIGVKTEVPNDSYVTVAKGTDTSPLKEADLNRFEQDNTSYGKKFVDGSVIFYNGTLHEHAVCGEKNCTDGHGDNEVWLPLTYDTEGNWLRSGGKSLSRSEDGHILPAGNYYLYENITTDRPIMIYGDVNLCLNGHTISTTAALAGNGKALIKNDGHSLTICDCSEQGKGEIKAPSGAMNGILTTGALTMYGGTITGGAQYGVYVTTFSSSSSTGTFQMYGGTITGNGTGVGRYENANTLTFGGDAKVKDNTSINVSLLNTGTITIDASLTKDAKIGVYFTRVPADKETKQFAAGATNDELNYANIFSCDNGSDYVLTKDTSGNLYFGKHQHVWSYTAEGATITATCTANGCNLPNQSGGSVTIVAPDKNTLTYDGNTKEATLEGALTTSVTLPDIKYYYKIGEQEYQLETGAKPTNAKSYRAEITVGGVNASVTYEIKKATPQARDFTFAAPTYLTYNGDPKTATVEPKTGISGMGDVAVKYYNENGNQLEEAPINVGTYTVKINVAESGNYNVASDLTDGWTFEIAKNTNTPDVTLSGEMIYTSKQITPAVTMTVDGKELVKDRDYTVTYGENKNAGTNTGVVYIEPLGNYGFNKYTRNFSITKRYIEIKADDKSSRVGQPLAELTYTCTEGLPYEGDTFSGKLATNANKDTAGTYDITQDTLTLGDNYNIDFKPGTYTVNAKDEQTNFNFAGVENGKVTKVYGADTEFTLAATGAATGSTVTYESTDTNVATVDGTGKVTIKGAGTAVIKATASATDDYAEATAQYTLTVSPKTLTKDDLEFTSDSTFTKVYDGGVTCTTATVQIKDSAKVTSGDELPTVTGTYAYNSKDVKDATKVTFTSAASDNTNYILPEGLTVENAANITKRVLTVGKVDTISKTYNTLDNALDCVTGIELIGTVSGETLRFYTSAETGGDYGIYETKFDNANVGQNKTITGTVTLLGSSALASNYTFEVDGKESSTAPFTATGEIIPADGGSKGDVERTQKFTDGDPKTETIAWKQLLPAGQTWNYNSSFNTSTGTLAHVDHSVNNNTGALTYTITGGSAGDQITFTVTAKCNNYDDFMYTVTVRLTARDPQALEFKGVENGKVAKTYGDAPFTQAVTGAQTKVTYTSSNVRVATVDNTGKVTIVGAGDTTITAAAAETDVYASASASYTLTVNKLRIAVPAPGKNKLEYDGTTQTYMPDRLDTAYCTITDNTAKDVRANNAHYTATVSLNDKANTEWDIAAENDTSNQTYDFWITPATAIVTALDKKITTGQSAPALANAKLGEDYTITGLYGSDSLGSIVLYYADPSNTATEVNPDTSKAGMYAIVAVGGGTGNPNYAPTFHTGTLTIANRPSSGGGAVTYPVSIPDKVENGSVSSDVKNASKGSTVTITIKPEDGFKLANLTVIDKDGNKLEIADKGDGKYTFIMPAGKVEVKACFTKEVETSPFADVATDAYYYEAVKWAAEQGITGGTGSGLFSPDYTCTRAQIVTFLWRAAGSPEPKAMSGFSDVPENSYYAKAVAWAVENGITVGTSSTTFSPEATCTRAQSVTFLFRAAKASADGTPAFSDVTANAYYAEAVKWATDNGITNGIGGGLFGPNNDCTRAQIITFLWRLYTGE